MSKFTSDRNHTDALVSAASDAVNTVRQSLTELPREEAIYRLDALWGKLRRQIAHVEEDHRKIKAGDPITYPTTEG